jgi:hypothetical protein
MSADAIGWILTVSFAVLFVVAVSDGGLSLVALA